MSRWEAVAMYTSKSGQIGPSIRYATSLIGCKDTPQALFALYEASVRCKRADPPSRGLAGVSVRRCRPAVRDPFSRAFATHSWQT